MKCYFCGLNLIPTEHNPTAMRCPDTKCHGYGFPIKEPMNPELDKIVENCDAKLDLTINKHCKQYRTEIIKSACLEYAALETKRADEAKANYALAHSNLGNEVFENGKLQTERNALQLRVAELEKDKLRLN